MVIRVRYVTLYAAQVGVRQVFGGGDMILASIITCPKCGHQATERMPEDACRFFYNCKGCGERLRPLPGHCCVFCSYGSVRCPPMQANAACSTPE